MDDQTVDLALRLYREDLERIANLPPKLGGRTEPATIHYTQLPDSPPDSPTACEWNFYRRVIGQLLAEGHAGKWLLIKDDQIVGIWNTEAEADVVRVQRFLRQPALMKQILVREPILRIGYNKLCRS
jgi:hypothetical protein